MLSVRMDPDLAELLEHDVDDLARYNLLRYLHDRPEVRGDVRYFADELGLRSLERTEEALEALTRRGLLVKGPPNGEGACRYSLSSDAASRELVDRLYRLSSTSSYGELVERLAAQSLRRARKAQTAHASRRNGHHHP